MRWLIAIPVMIGIFTLGDKVFGISPTFGEVILVLVIGMAYDFIVGWDR